MTNAELFDIEGVTLQREVQCEGCPDSPHPTPDTVALTRRIGVRPHRCDKTPNALCAGPLRPRILDARGAA